MPGFGNWLRNTGYRIADHFVSGDNYNPNTGQWTATPGQYVTGIGSSLLNLLAPGLGTAAGKGFDYYYNHQGNPNMGGPTQNTIPTYPSMSVNDLGGFGYSGMPNYSPSFNPFTTSDTNPYDQFTPPSGNIFDPTGTFSGNPGYGGGASSGYTGNGGMGWAQNAGGGQSQGGGIGFGWTGISGDAARGVFSGLASASDDAVQAEAAAEMRRMRQ